MMYMLSFNGMKGVAAREQIGPEAEGQQTAELCGRASGLNGI